MFGSGRGGGVREVLYLMWGFILCFVLLIGMVIGLVGILVLI